MKKIFSSLLIFGAFLVIANTASADEIIFSPINLDENIKNPLKTGILNMNNPKVYKPTKLVLGEKAKFKIKAKPGLKALFMASLANTGTKVFHGKTLHLGPVFNTQEQIIPETGVLELFVSVVDDKKLIGEEIFFEVLLWEKDDYSDITKARIIGANGAETDRNYIFIKPHHSTSSIPGFTPAIPGGGNVMDTIDSITKDEEGEKLYDIQYTQQNTPAVIRNLHSVEIQKSKNEK